MSQETEAAQVFQQCKDILQNTKREISKRIVAQDAAIDGIRRSGIGKNPYGKNFFRHNRLEL